MQQRTHSSGTASNKLRPLPLRLCAGAPQKRRAVKLSEDSQLFEAGQLGAAPGGGGLTTYKVGPGRER